MDKTKLFEEIEEYALHNSVPIIQKDGLEVLEEYIKKNRPQTILEIGTAIGYSALKMNDINDCSIKTFERNEQMIKEAKLNIKKFNKEHKIILIEEDFLNYNINKFEEKFFDLIYIDGAKAQYYNFFKHIESKIGPNTIVLFDNLNFHNFVYNEEKKKNISKNLRQLIKKIERFLEQIQKEEQYKFEYISQGDGIGVLQRR